MPGTACSGRSLAVDLTEVASASRINEDPLTATSISLNFHRFLLAFALNASLAELQLAGPDEPRLGVPALQSALLFAVLPGQHRLADWAEQDIVFTAVPRPIQHELALFVALAAGREVEYSRAAPGCTRLFWVHSRSADALTCSRRRCGGRGSGGAFACSSRKCRCKSGGGAFSLGGWDSHSIGSAGFPNHATCAWEVSAAIAVSTAAGITLTRGCGVVRAGSLGAGTKSRLFVIIDGSGGCIDGSGGCDGVGSRASGDQRGRSFCWRQRRDLIAHNNLIHAAVSMASATCITLARLARIEIACPSGT